MDGRQLPNPKRSLVGVGLPSRWVGNTLSSLTVTTNATWIDHWLPAQRSNGAGGALHADQLYTLELKMVLTDSAYYAKPWLQTKRMHLIPRDFPVDGWSGLLEDLCAPVDEVLSTGSFAIPQARASRPSRFASGARAARSAPPSPSRALRVRPDDEGMFSRSSLRKASELCAEPVVERVVLDLDVDAAPARDVREVLD
jgi:hypothetical protein